MSEKAWKELDSDGIDEATSNLRRHLAAQCAIVEPDLAARIHRALGRHTFTLFDNPTSIRAYLAQRDLTPDWTPETMDDVPPMHPVREVWEVRTNLTFTLEESPPGGWVVDGTLSHTVPQDRAFILQALTKDQEVSWTGWILNTSEIPVAPWRAQRLRRTRMRGTAVSASIAGIGGGLLVAGIVNVQRLNSSPASEYRQIQRESNALGASAYGAFAASGVSLAVLWGVKW
jgi:hypothetical protein